MPTRVVETDADRDMLVKFIEGQKLPVTVDITSGKHRTTKANRLQRQWMNDIASQLGESAEYWRGWCKLHIGIGIIKADNEAFAKAYDDEIKPLPYELKMKLMQEPFDFAVTRKMTSAQMTLYLDTIQRDFTERGIQLTDPEAMKWK